MFKVTATTVGQGNPSHVGAGKPYRYRKDPDWTPGCYLQRKELPRAPLPQNVKAIAGKQARVAEYIRLRTVEGLSRKQAQDRMGVSRSASGYYEKELRARQQGDDAP